MSTLQVRDDSFERSLIGVGVARVLVGDRVAILTLGPAVGVVMITTTYRWDVTGVYALPPPAVIIDGTARAAGLPQIWIIEPAAP